MSNAHYVLSLQGSYKESQITLYKNGRPSQNAQVHNTSSSAALIPLIEIVLNKEHIHLNELDYIALDYGPGAFTSLRVTVVTANAISFASNVPLVGVNGLEAIIEEVIAENAQLIKDKKIMFIAALLNAYNNDVYACCRNIQRNEYVIPHTCIKINEILDKLTNLSQSGNILFTGNGSSLHKDMICKRLGHRAFYEKLTTQHCSSDFVAKLAFKLMRSDYTPVKKILPFYLKPRMYSPPPKKAN